jgi:undecaprenyl diphosphate synthase
LKKLNHIAIIPDGNRRWAKKHGKSISEGHWAGIQKLQEVAGWCKELGVKYLTLWIFSTENASRPSEEVSTLFKLFDKMLDEVEKKYDEDEGVSFRFVGRLDLFPKELVARAKSIEEKTKGRSLQVIILMGYGGRQEIVDAVNKLIGDVKKGKTDKIDEKTFTSYLYAPDVPDPDLIIRTAEKRLSGLLPWQGVYSEIYFCKKLWPEFTKKDLAAAVRQYYATERRFGR